MTSPPWESVSPFETGSRGFGYFIVSSSRIARAMRGSAFSTYVPVFSDCMDVIVRV